MDFSLLTSKVDASQDVFARGMIRHTLHPARPSRLKDAPLLGYPRMPTLKGKRVFITGGTTGIGRTSRIFLDRRTATST
jgi:hypothetical protein